LKKALKKNSTKLEIDSGVNCYTFSNGLQLVHKQSLGTQTSNMGFVINVGSRDDGNLPGIAHFFEHMLFRGTHKRSSTQIINRIEWVGGELNAFTAKDVTVVYANVLSDYFDRSIELLADIVFNSKFSESALSKEQNIIREEINLYLDTPEEYLYDEFLNYLYQSHPMGYNILGTEDTIAQIGIKQLNQFYTTYYQPENMVLSVVSDLDFEKVLKLCSGLEQIQRAPIPEKPKVQQLKKSKKFDRSFEKDFNLAYVCLGKEAYAHDNKKKYGLMLLNNILGGPGMNSKLNMTIREKRGLTYQIDSTYTSYDNTGVFYINFATEMKQLDLTLQLIEKEIGKLCGASLSKNEIGKAKQQFKNQMRMAEESKNALMVYHGKQLLLYDQVQPLSVYLERIDDIQADDLRIVAQEIMEFSDLAQLKLIPI